MSRGKLPSGVYIKHVPSVYSPEQVSRYLARISYPNPPSDPKEFHPTLENLEVLMQCHITTFAFENSVQHYSEHHTMPISPSYLYERMVKRAEGGHYCFGNNGLFAEMLKGLGYRTYTGAGRINVGPSLPAPPSFLAFVHKVIFVQPSQDDNTTYFLDASSGGSCMTRPILLEDGEWVEGATPSEWHGLVKSARGESSLATSLKDEEAAKIEWRLLVKHVKSPDGNEIDTKLLYSFITDEFHTADYEFANYGVYTSTNDIFWHSIVGSRCFWLSPQEEKEMVDQLQNWRKLNSATNSVTLVKELPSRYLGRYSMEGRVVKRHIGPRTTIVCEMKSELDRRDALQKFFGVVVREEDLHWVKGRPPAFNQ
ncbi:arylamine n-acetyltransferase 1 [Moniliophthora roreri]|nr:arylamine n-acetyltransferase 1 [Moniliophthora roreri]